MIKAIVFDIGGVLLRTDDRSSRQELESKYHLKPGEADQLVFNSQAAQESTIGRASQKRVWENVAVQLKLSDDELEDFQKIFWANDRVDQELIAFLQECRKSYTTALLSNAWVDARETFADQYGLIEGKTVDQILFSYELGLAKPDPQIYHALSEKLECNFNEIIFVDDFIENVIAAQALGIHAIHFSPEMDLIDRIKARLSKP